MADRVIETTVGELPAVWRHLFAQHPADMPVELVFADGPIEDVGSKDGDADAIAWVKARWNSARLSDGWLEDRGGVPIVGTR